ncbi:hypothetical protein PSN13_06506 [Micromonospora saelicesensis]|uniref:Uncharacterized protein n=1 Tax=Micromonospora saelicesensis TaxID=285676 RepID=A0A328NCS3_9ACTN|nr:hypothetical protein [Micromonospora saelicesensis]RAO26478.1 hypothetical protein PSN13_06506 [Micromonospora saelicesensis]
MAKLTANTHVRHPETGELAFLVAGGDVPEWAAPLVGDHLIEGGSARSRKPSAPKAPAEDPAVELARLEARVAELKATPKSEPVTPVERQDGPPPKGGAGSGAPSWREYAARNNVEVASDASREDVVAALDAAGVRTE